MLPRLIWRLEAQMRGRLNQPDFLYEATRVYLMLGSAGPLDRDLVHDWMMLDWQADVDRPRQCAVAVGIAEASRRAAGRAVAAGATGWRPGGQGAQHVQPGVRWRNGFTRGSDPRPPHAT